MIKPIIHDLKILQKPCDPAKPQDLQIAHDLLDTLQAHRQNCVGLAANMIGISKQIIAVSIGPAHIAMLNPKIIHQHDPYQTKEGCLSLPGQRLTTRYQTITVKFTDIQGQPQRLTLSDFPAQIVQHEVDHCNGTLI
ncbi:peptide deformylase [uncultured Limosilactobacillus sp.]|uniref:peptide deformylase n=1 Tax=uncultured Limosilactobacillus sp. TaxID=2837629 RepID=UPI0025F679CD|nr:peptide deformylase [uncultured Limosilactobacillus sp.]